MDTCRTYALCAKTHAVERFWGRKAPPKSLYCVSPDLIVTPKIATPKIATPKIATPKIATPKIATPKIATPKIATPKYYG